MTEQGEGTKPVTFPSPAQGGIPSGNNQEAGEQTPQYLTRDDALKLIAEVEDRTTRKLQSSFDKSSQTLQKKVQAEINKIESAVEMMKGQNINLTDGQIEAMRQKAIQKVLTESESNESPTPSKQEKESQADQPGGDGGRDIELVNQIADELFAEAGFTIEENEPEAKLIDFSNGAKFVKTLQKAIQAKEERLASESVAKVPGLGGSGRTNPIPQNLKAMDYFKMAYGNRR